MTEPALKYSRAFETFVQDQEDLEGLIAYSFYKQHKRDWIIRYKQEEGVNVVPDHIINEFERMMLLDLHISDLRNNASNTLGAYADEYTRSQTPQIRLEALSAEVIGARDTVKQAQSF